MNRTAADADTYRRLLAAVHRLDLVTRRSADRTLQAALGMGRAQFLVLERIAELQAGELSQQAIADELGLTRAAVSRHVIDAEQARLVTVRTSPASRRENRVRLTDAGRRAVRAGRRRRDAAAAAALDGIAAGKVTATLEVLERLAARLS